MANRTYNQFQGTLLKGVVTLYAKLTAASGAITVVTQEVINAGTSPVTINPSNGFVSTTVAAPAGPFYEYLFPLQDPYVRLLGASAVAVQPSGASIPVSVVVTEDNVTNQNAPSVKLSFACMGIATPPAANTIGPALPADGTILLKLELSNSTAL